MASVLNDVAGETKDQAIVGLVMVTDRELTQMFGVRKIPTIVILRNTQISASFVGVVSKEQIRQLLKGA
jgi:thioredoxin-like negative regulator of GroEL